MGTTSPSPVRIAVVAAFALSCFALLLVLWIAFGGPVPLKPKGYRFTTTLMEAGQLAPEADVRISGVPVGRVVRVEAQPRLGRSRVEIELSREHAPLPAGARAILRSKTLLGETYVELAPGRRSGPVVPDGGALAAAQVAPTVELDEVLRALDPSTRRALRGWLGEQAVAVGANGDELNAALATLPAFADDAGAVLDVLRRQDGALRRVVRDTGTVLDALTERDGQLRALITSSERAFATTARRDRELAETVRALPGFAREAERTVRRLSRFARDTDPLVTQLRPAARELGPTLRDLAAAAPDLRRLLEGLEPLIAASRRGLPAGERVLRDLRPLLAQVDPAARELVPLLAFLGLYDRELVAFFANAAAATQAREPGGEHYLRTTNPLNAENLAAYPQRLGTNRPNPYPRPGTLDALAAGLPVYEDRQCGRPPPTLSDRLPDGPPGALVEEVRARALPALAPPCRVQPGTPRYPRVGGGG